MKFASRDAQFPAIQPSSLACLRACRELFRSWVTLGVEGSMGKLLVQSQELANLVMAARCHFAQKASWTSVRSDIDEKLRGPVHTSVLPVRAELWQPKFGLDVEKALVKAWETINTEYSIGEARHTNAEATEHAKPQVVELASVLRAACLGECWSLAQLTHARLNTFQPPAGRDRALIELSRAELDVWRTVNVKEEEEDPVSKLTAGPRGQMEREVETRRRAVRLCEQCIITGRDVDLIKEAAVTLWNVGKELLCFVEVVDEVQSVRMV